MTQLDKSKAELKHEMLDEFGYIFCGHCKRSDKIIYHFHHLIFRSEKPGHKMLHNRINLIYLCNDCHTAFHKNKAIRSDLVKERNLVEIFGSEILNCENKIN